jgi:hypothetical protein
MYLRSGLLSLQALVFYQDPSSYRDTMCGGPEVISRPRGGALVALNTPRDETPDDGFYKGDLAFHTPGQPASTTATHVRLTPSEECRLDDDDRLRVVIQCVFDHSPILVAVLFLTRHTAPAVI